MGSVAVRETNTSFVFLVGDRAYKVKKPVDLGFLDFRTVEARGKACADEFTLNSRLCPDVYLDLATVTGSDGRVIDHVLVMKRMPDERRLSTLIRNGDPVDDDVRAIARMLADFHTRAERGPHITEVAIEGLRRRWHNNLLETERFKGTLLPVELHEEISELVRDYLHGRATLLRERAERGMAVDGHADLITDDVFCLPDHPRVLDCLEFDANLRYVDALDDAAFLAMDIEHLGAPVLARRFLRWYEEFSGYPTARSLEHHYIAYRAYVRAKVACIKASLAGEPRSPDARAYAYQALDHLRAGQVRLVLVGGGPASGKTTLATRLADRLGAVLLRTDVIRNEMPELAGHGRYSPEAKSAVYDELLRRAGFALERGESVVADATWSSELDRKTAVSLAADTASSLQAFECRVPEPLAVERAQERQRGGLDASEAGPDEVRLLAHRDPWPEATPIDTAGTPEQSFAAAWLTLRVAEAQAGSVEQLNVG